MATAEDKRQALSKAMGAAFLSHQVAQLERSVDSITFSRDARLYDPGRRGGRGGGRAGAHGGNRDSAERSTEPRQRRVVDASALVHALPLIKKWVRENAYQLVVPLQAFSTLDILKKAPNPLHDQARDATRFLEQQLSIAQQISTSFGGLDADSRIRLRAQAADEELSWTEVEKAFTVPSGFVVERPPKVVTTETDDASEDGEEPFVPSANDIPRSLRSALQCAFYFQLHAPDHDTASLVLFSNSIPVTTPYDLAIEDPPASTDSARAPLDFLALSSGDALEYWVNTFFPDMSTYVVPAAVVTSTREWLKAQAQAKEHSERATKAGGDGGDGERSGKGGKSGRGRGGRGGRGGGGGGGEGRGGRGGMKGRGGAPSKTLFVP